MKFFNSFTFMFLIISYASGQATNTFPTSGNVGIGTTDPSASLHVLSGLNNGLRIDGGSDDSGRIFTSYESSKAYLNFIEYDDPFVLRFLQTQDSASAIIGFNNGNLGVGTFVPDTKLTVNGDIHAREIKVDLGGAVAPDFVFRSDYLLPKLHVVNQYIQEYQHLPNIPSAADMERNGILLKDMNLKLLQKIEELTLYIIQENERSNTLEARLKLLEELVLANAEMKKEMNDQRELIIELEEKIKLLLK